jgi:hypothetical protein
LYFRVADEGQVRVQDYAQETLGGGGIHGRFPAPGLQSMPELSDGFS